MQFIIQQISPSRKEIRIAIDSITKNGLDMYQLGTVNGHFDNGTLDPKYIPPTNGFEENSINALVNLGGSVTLFTHLLQSTAVVSLVTFTHSPQKTPVQYLPPSTLFLQII